MLTVALLALTAFAAGVTGAWSPCGFSMVETIAGAAGREGDAARRVVRASCATFAVGAVVGGALTFGLLGGLGALVGAGGDTALAIAAVIALAAAAADALGLRIAPQIRRQVPEPWRRTLPLPLAVALYGVLLGLGFTTFVLAFAVWALAGVSVALGSPLAGVAIGVAFGLGRALPVIALAPRFDDRGMLLAGRMAEEPRLLRRLRAADAALLLASAVALLLGGGVATADAAAPAARDGAAQPAARSAHAHGPARAARWTVVAAGASDPSWSEPGLLFRTGTGAATLRLPDGDVALPGGPVALGGPHLAQVEGGAVVVTDWTAGRRLVATVPIGAPVARLAVSSAWIAWVTDDPDGGQTLSAAPLANAAGAPVVLARVGRRGGIGRPALAGSRVAYAVSSARGGSRIVVRDLAAPGVPAQVVVRSQRTLLSQPALRHDRLLYVRAGHCDQRLLLARLAGGRSRTLLRLGTTARRDPGHERHRTTQGREPGECPHGTPGRSAQTLWTTALGEREAWVTLLRPGTSARPARTTLVRVAR